MGKARLDPEELRLVLATNVLIRAHWKIPSRASRILQAVLRSGHLLVTSNELLSEVARVLRYPKLQAMAGLADGDNLEYVQSLQAGSKIVRLGPIYLAPMRDPSDLIILQTAERDFSSPKVMAYCASHGIEIVDEQTLASRLL